MNLEKDVEINDKNNNLFINSNEINYDIINELIISRTDSEIVDNLGNIYKVKEFEYSLKKKIIKLNQLIAFDANKNIHIEDNLLILLISCFMFLKLFNKKITKIK